MSWFPSPTDRILLGIAATLNRMERILMSDQDHLNTVVSSIASGFAEVVAELKAQAVAGAPLDFTAADALVATVAAEATADAPPAPPA